MISKICEIVCLRATRFANFRAQNYPELAHLHDDLIANTIEAGMK